VAIPFLERYRRRTAARFQQTGVKCRRPTDSSVSIDRASRAGRSGSKSRVFGLPRPETISRARGRGQSFAAAESTLTHHAIRKSNHASFGCVTDFLHALLLRRITFVTFEDMRSARFYLIHTRPQQLSAIVHLYILRVTLRWWYIKTQRRLRRNLSRRSRSIATDQAWAMARN
jgi:hypothetical protein